MAFRATPIAAALVALNFTLGCGKAEGEREKTSDRAGSSVSSSVDSAASKVTKAEAEKFAQEVAAAYENNDLVELSALVNFEAMAKEATRDLGVSEAERASLIEELLDGVYGRYNLLVTIRNGKEGVSYRPLRVHEQDGEQRVLFRVSTLPGVNYHEFTLGKEDGVVTAHRIYSYSSGESMAEMWRRRLPRRVQSKNGPGELAAKESDDAKHARDIGKFTQQTQAGAYAEALTTFASLPESIRNEKNLLLLRFDAAKRVGGAAAQEAGEDFQRLYPNDPAFALAALDYHLLSKNYEEALAYIDRIDQAVGGDDYLNVLRGSVYLEQEQFPEAIRYYQLAAAGCPDMVDCQWFLAGGALVAKDHQVLYETLRKLEEDFGEKLEGLQSAPEYADFVASPQGQKWLAEHGFTD